MDRDEDLDTAVYKAQEAINSWGNLLQATGGALQPEKCKWTVHDMVPRSDGTWGYRRCKPAMSTIEEGKVLPGTDMMDRIHKGAEEEQDDDHYAIDGYVVKVPQSSGEEAAIDQLQSCQAVKNLGLYAPPEGSSKPQLQALRDRVDEWTMNMKNGHLPTRSTWMSYNCQLWAGLRYGIGAAPARLKDLENKVKYQVKTEGKKKVKTKIESGLGTRDHKILSMLGICQNITTEWRYLPSCYGVMELNCLTIKAIAASLNLLL